MNAWLKCRSKPGIFNDEQMVGVKTIDGYVHLFAPHQIVETYSNVVPDAAPGSALTLLKVKALPASTFVESNGHGECRRVILPSKSVEGPRCIVVLASDLQFR